MKKDETPRKQSLPIVGVGASAGGLEAFQQFFTGMPPDTGMAFVIVQHLDPTHESMLVDLLSRYTRMQVHQITDGIQVRADNLYIIPPNRDMVLENNELKLTEPTAPRGFRLPIDSFFRSLAKEREEYAICIVLSGTGSDGSLGLKAVKEAGGLTMAQKPATAKYDGMPHSAIATGMVDFILSPGEMPQQLLNYFNQSLQNTNGETPVLMTDASDALEKIFLKLRLQTGHDFSQYKTNTISRRIERRMVVNRMEDIYDYVNYLENDENEANQLFRELMIGVTSFFRDKSAFEVLEHKAIPQIFADRDGDDPVRVWVTGCSTGEEAYSIAILLREYMDKIHQEYEVQIFATDIDDRSIQKARQGIYPDNIVADVNPGRLSRFFHQDGTKYQISKNIRDMVIFATQSLIKDPPFSRMDLITCRNLLIYMGNELQRRIIPLFHYALRPSGFLFLGTSETLGENADLFDAIDRRNKLYKRVDRHLSVISPRFSLDRMANSISDAEALGKRSEKVNIRTITEKILLDDFSPPGVIVNENDEVIYLHKDMRDYLNLPQGEISLSVVNMAHRALRAPLATAIRRARETQEVIFQPNIRLSSDEQIELVTLTVQPVQRPASMQGLLLIVFEHVVQSEPVKTAFSSKDDNDNIQRVIELEHELNATRQYLQTLIEELETTNEELKSTNEELQSANEELQSTNEELETAKEELQSVNEELVTVNVELQSKLEELSHANNDLNNLLSTLEIAIIFVDLNLNVRQFNPAASKLVNLIESDIGRPLRHIVSNFNYSNLMTAAEQVLDTLIPVQEEVETFENQWYWMVVRPYRTSSNTIEGVVITFSEITEQKSVQAELYTFKHTMENSHNIIIITDNTGNIEYVNPAYLALSGYDAEQVYDKHINDLRSNPELKPSVEDNWRTLQREGEWSGELLNSTVKGESFWVYTTASAIRDSDDNIIRYLFVEDDITEKREIEARLKEADLYSMLISHLPGFAVFLYDEELQFIDAEGVALREAGYQSEYIKGRSLMEVVSDKNYETLEKVYQSALAGEMSNFKITSMENVTYEGRSVPIKNENGDVIAGMVITWQTE